MYTIITVCLNAADDLEQTIQSVLLQKDCEIEYIIKDGMSTDHTMDVVRKYEPELQKLSRFVFVSEKDTGLYDAMNIATKMAQGERLLFLNAGDVLADELVFKDISALAADEDILYGNVFSREENRRMLRKPDDTSSLEKIKKGMFFCHQAALIRSEVMKELLYDTQYRICADYDFFLRAFCQGRSFRYVDRAIAGFQLGGLSDRKAFDLLDESYRIRYSNGVLSAEECDRLRRNNRIKKFSRDLIPRGLYEYLKKQKRRFKQRNWDIVK